MSVISSSPISLFIFLIISPLLSHISFDQLELGDFIKRAVKSGAEYKFLDNCYVNTSLRRYEKKWGYTKMILFWIIWRACSLFKADKDLVKDYFEIKR